MMRWAEHVESMWDMIIFFKIVFGNPEGKRSLGRSRRGWEDNIKTDLDICLDNVRYFLPPVHYEMTHNLQCHSTSKDINR
jgi:hypothetical protein